MKKGGKKTALLTLAIGLLLSACNSNNRATESSNAESDTALMDTPMTTGTGSDTLLKDSLKEGVDGTGKSSTDPRTRKQQ
jgi:hypothetical protein